MGRSQSSPYQRKTKHSKGNLWAVGTLQKPINPWISLMLRGPWGSQFPLALRAMWLQPLHSGLLFQASLWVIRASLEYEQEQKCVLPWLPPAMHSQDWCAQHLLSFYCPGSCQLEKCCSWSLGMGCPFFFFLSELCTTLGMFSPWIIDLPAITVAIITLQPAWLPFLPYIILAHTLSYAFNNFVSRTEPRL